MRKDLIQLYRGNETTKPTAKVGELLIVMDTKKITAGFGIGQEKIIYREIEDLSLTKNGNISGVGSQAIVFPVSVAFSFTLANNIDWILPTNYNSFFKSFELYDTIDPTTYYACYTLRTSDGNLRMFNNTGNMNLSTGTNNRISAYSPTTPTPRTIAFANRSGATRTLKLLCR
jgi:hypothetical protein